MQISDELIACYVEGTATEAEQSIIREYHCKHPDEYERVLCLMDLDTKDHLNEQKQEVPGLFGGHKASLSGVVYSAAAFAPQPKNTFSPKAMVKSSSVEGLYGRLCLMSNKIDELK